MSKADQIDQVDGTEEFADELTAGTTLMHGQYTIESFLNAGGFGITYIARDNLGRQMVIKECFPGSFCRRSKAMVNARSRAHTGELSSIVGLFLQEARSLSKLEHPNIVRVHNVFEDNNTAYMALDYVDGRDLLSIINADDQQVTPDQVENMLRQLLDAIGYIHRQGVLHRDVSPDNILMDGEMNPILIDFGAAREEATKQSRALSAMRVVKDGYSPQELYVSGSAQGAYSDLYALGATFYHLIAGEVPPNSQARLSAVAAGEEDPYQPLAGRMAAYPNTFLKAIDNALQILPQDRIESAEAWRAMIDGTEYVAPTEGVGAMKTTTKPSALSAEPEKKGSKNGMLLATAAVVGGVAIYLGQGQLLKQNDAAPAAPLPVAAAPAAPAVPAPAPVLGTAAVPVLGADPAPVVTAEADAPASGLDAIPGLAVAEPAPEPAPEPDAAAALFAAIDAEAKEDAAADMAAADPAPLPADIVLPEQTAEAESIEPAPAQTAEPETLAIVTPEPQTPAPEALPEVQETERAAASATTEDTPTPAAEPASVNGMLTGWMLDLPSDYGFDITDGDARILEVNGIAVGNRPEFDSALRASLARPNTAELEVEVKMGATAENAFVETLSLPVKYRTVFPNGFAFETAQTDGAWLTQAISVPASGASEIRVGDVIIGDLTGQVRFDTRTGFPATVEAALLNGDTMLTVAVKRGNDMTAAALPLPLPGATPTN